MGFKPVNVFNCPLSSFKWNCPWELLSIWSPEWAFQDFLSFLVYENKQGFLYILRKEKEVHIAKKP